LRKNIFSHNKEISSLVDELYLSINWDVCINDENTGSLFMMFNDDGSGTAPLKPFNEYMIVAWMAKNYYKNNTRAVNLWNNLFLTPDTLPKETYK